MSTVGAVTQVSNVPIKYDSRVRTCGWWSRGGRLSLIRSHHISWQVWDNLAVVCSMCSLWFGESEVATDKWMNGRRTVSQTLWPTPTTIIVLGTCNIGPFFCFTPISTSDHHAFNPTIGSSVIFSVKEPLWMSPSKSDVSIFQHHNKKKFIISHCPPLTR